MRIAHAFIPVIVLAIVIAGWLGLSYWRKQHEIRAVSFIKIEVLKEWAYTNDFYGAQFTGIKRLLDSSECGSILAKTSGAEAQSFSFDKVAGVHGTKLIYLQYSGHDSNVVLTVASNAANLVVLFYKTNFPSFEASYIETQIRK